LVVKLLSKSINKLSKELEKKRHAHSSAGLPLVSVRLSAEMLSPGWGLECYYSAHNEESNPSQPVPEIHGDIVTLTLIAAMWYP
jgi:hypothetical protein